MIRALLFLLAITASGARAEERSSAQRAWFPDGTGLEIFAEGTGSTQISAPQGITGITGGITDNRGVDRIFRVVADRDNNALFGYFLEAYRNTQTDTSVIRILPLDESTAANTLKSPALGFKSATGLIPTVSAVREFQSVKIGEAVTLDILYKPSTGEKIYDVLRPIAGPSPNPTGMSVTAVPTPPQFSLKGIKLRVNGQRMNAPVSWIIGAAVRIDVPGHGAYVIAANDPKGSGYKFYSNVRADGKSLKWSIDGEQIEITSQTNVGVDGIIWVYHDANYRAQDQPGAVRLQTADTVDWLLPKVWAGSGAPSVR